MGPSVAGEPDAVVTVASLPRDTGDAEFFAPHALTSATTAANNTIRTDRFGGQLAVEVMRQMVATVCDNEGVCDVAIDVTSYGRASGWNSLPSGRNER